MQQNLKEGLQRAKETAGAAGQLFSSFGQVFGTIIIALWMGAEACSRLQPSQPTSNQSRVVEAGVLAIPTATAASTTVTEVTRQPAKKATATIRQPATAAVAATTTVVTASDLVETIPDGRGNYRTGVSMNAQQFEAEMASGKYKYILRLSSDVGKDRGALFSREMIDIAARHGVQYVTYEHPDRFNAHAGYRKGSGYFGALEAAYPFFRQGGVLVVCRGGYRSGALIGAWLALNGWTWPRIVEYNGWDKITNPTEKEQKYFETVKAQLQ